MLKTSNEYQWQILRTRPGQEKKVARLLSRRKIVNYCPLMNTGRDVSGLKREKSTPLFPSYVFINVDASMFEIALKLEAVVGCIYWLNAPAIVSMEEIEVIRQVLQEGEIIHLKQVEVDCTGEVETRISANRFITGEYDGFNDRRVTISLPSLGYHLAVVASQSFKYFNIPEKYRVFDSKI